MSSEKYPDETSESLCFLVVDDDAEVRTTVTEYLGTFGYTKILQADDVYDALSLLQNEKVDFVISDWEMPKVNGLEFLKILRGKVETRHLPFVMITSPISQEGLKIMEAASCQVDAYIIKPFRARILKEKIDLVIQERELKTKTGALVVDDDENVRGTVVEILQALGFDPVLQAFDGEQGLNVLKENINKIGIVLSDWEMPKMEGIELLRKIRIDPEISSTLFIMITSQRSIEQMKLKQAIEADVDHYLMKPFKMEDLKGKIGTVLKKAKLAREIDHELSSARGAIEEACWIEADKRFRHVLNLDPKNVRAVLGLAVLHLKQHPKKGYDEAIRLIRSAIAVNPKFDESYIELANAFESAMSLDKSIVALKQGLEQCPLSEKLHFHLGRLLLRRGRAEEGIAEIEKAVELKPDYKEALEILAMNPSV